MRAEINEVESRKITEKKSTKLRLCFLKEITKLVNSNLNYKKREDSNKIRNKWDDIPTDATEIKKDYKRLLWIIIFQQIG